ncbi:outer membrane receptor for ferrienterochelin and colicins [Anseongella ginsenosidimutans]|uniref:Outer membrane receptor for ferrienterochelin and colicins n=1 Tax=Anseongella ginsenosidimutans TaxID=496056 RepID=A0A4R3KS15_9SPHI|nr:TonB-dependent receptor [Anseongella ginsenosidimutans]QEC54258.1 TonB-dependent receptor [Anseongella ginsenosidimutans]TCS87307.1 outer membrane receptor for ferrienterochelin and colicins [Anseongella ginsenosidimutans]
MIRNILLSTGLALCGYGAAAQAEKGEQEAGEEEPASLEQVVVSGTMKEVLKLESPVPVEVYTSSFFKANPTPSIFDALQHVNGVRPQLNCNICNTGDIHINGLEGAYTMVLINGMPIVSGLSTVYGLSGIPQALIERVEIVKGPASTLYGSEAVAGLINIITKKPEDAPVWSADVFTTSWAEVSADIAAKFEAGRKAHSLAGINYFNYRHPVDGNDDGFTDVTLQNRFSVFNKWDFERENGRLFSLAGRYIYEDRWGGEMDWNRKYRGGDDLYGESIYTSRWEVFGNYQLPVEDNILFRFSANGHDQNSMYGTSPYLADQYIAFGQLTWNKPLQHHDLLAGLTYRYTWYNDNTPATADFDDPAADRPVQTRLPGIFLQDEITIDFRNKLLLGFRYDYHSVHGSILTPRLNYKWSSGDKNNVLRLSLGSGYRVANVFTEDHAALTGAREVVFEENLDPERSWNGNLNFVKKIFAGNYTFIGLDATLFYTHFNNKIIADYDTDPNKIMYRNLEGYAISKGISLNADIDFSSGLKILVGGTLMDVYSKENGEKRRQQLTEKFAGVWNISYTLKGTGLKIDYTGNLYGPMRLPLLSEQDPRSAYSPWWSIQNIQVSTSLGERIEIYGGLKNLLNWRPGREDPFIIARAHDPFDKQVVFDNAGQAIATDSNPYGLTFDPAYVYGPNQGIRGFFGVRFTHGSVSKR